METVSAIQEMEEKIKQLSARNEELKYENLPYFPFSLIELSNNLELML